MTIELYRRELGNGQMVTVEDYGFEYCICLRETASGFLVARISAHPKAEVASITTIIHYLDAALKRRSTTHA